MFLAFFASSTSPSDQDLQDAEELATRKPSLSELSPIPCPPEPTTMPTSVQDEFRDNPVIKDADKLIDLSGGPSNDKIVDRPRCCCIKISTKATIVLALIVSVVVSFLVSFFWGRLEKGTAPEFQDSFDEAIYQWRNRGAPGLELNIRNALSSDWERFFVQAVNDWDAAPALSLSYDVSTLEDPLCDHASGIIKACNGYYGENQMLGWNELMYYESANGKNIVVSSVIKINDTYLNGTPDSQKQYVMCHEIGHGFGLGHRDVDFNNPDLGSCLDYTLRYSNNIQPDPDVDFENLRNLYGVIGSSKLRRAVQNKDYQDYETQQLFEEVIRTRKWNYKEGRRLHQSKRREVYENDLGDGVRVLTTLLLANDM